ncbi:UPF0058 family protein [Haloferax namakaokahaiae]|uniref:UPF0058 family protein n=1 Tax=Haloferax namakaokahaiae TaxID=1748331 RepID=A0ABD5ZF12_9EURY
MKKNELIHLHTLLVEIANDFIDRGVATPADLAAYNRLGIGPMALRACRADHEVAVRTLTTALAVCAVRDRGHDTARVPGQHLLASPPDSDDSSDSDGPNTHERVPSN